MGQNHPVIPAQPLQLLASVSKAEDCEGLGHRRISQVADPQDSPCRHHRPIPGSGITILSPPSHLISSPGRITTLCIPHSCLFLCEGLALCTRGPQERTQTSVCQDHPASLLVTMLFFFLSFFFFFFLTNCPSGREKKSQIFRKYHPSTACIKSISSETTTLEKELEGGRLHSCAGSSVLGTGFACYPLPACLPLPLPPSLVSLTSIFVVDQCASVSQPRAYVCVFLYIIPSIEASEPCKWHLMQIKDSSICFRYSPLPLNNLF